MTKPTRLRVESVKRDRKTGRERARAQSGDRKPRPLAKVMSLLLCKPLSRQQQQQYKKASLVQKEYIVEQLLSLLQSLCVCSVLELII